MEEQIVREHGQEVEEIDFRRALRDRSASTATAAANGAATTAIRAICQPGMPPTTTVWTSTGGGVVPTGEVVTPDPDPGGGTCMANAGVAPNATRAPASPASAAANRR